MSMQEHITAILTIWLFHFTHSSLHYTVRNSWEKFNLLSNTSAILSQRTCSGLLLFWTPNIPPQHTHTHTHTHTHSRAYTDYISSVATGMLFSHHNNIILHSWASTTIELTDYKHLIKTSCISTKEEMDWMKKSPIYTKTYTISLEFAFDVLDIIWHFYPFHTQSRSIDLWGSHIQWYTIGDWKTPT